MKNDETKKCPECGQVYVVMNPHTKHHSVECKRKSIINQLKTKQNDKRLF